MKEKFNDSEKTLFEQFFEENPNCSKFKDNIDAKAIFDILSKKKNIQKMIEVSAFGKPALSVCVEEIENYWDSLTNPQMNLTDDFTLRAIGRMVRTILVKYGYKVTIQKDMPKSSKSKYWKSASCYEKRESELEAKFLTLGGTMAVSKGSDVYEKWHLEYNIVFVVSNDCYDTTAVSINGNEFKYAVNYHYRSQGNAHLIFWSEGGLWFAMSFDGHKGDMVVNNNSIIEHLITTLNEREKLNDTGERLSTLSINEIYDIFKTYEQMRKES